MKRLVAIVVALAAGPSLAAGKPLAITLAPGVAIITEGDGINFTLLKSGGNGKPAPAKITATGISCPATAVPGSTFICSTVDDSIVNGTRTATVLVTASTGATARASVTIRDNDTAAPPPPATQTCPDGSVIPASSACPPPPVTSVTSWVASTGPVQIGGYVFVKGSRADRQCCSGLIMRVTGRAYDAAGHALDMWSVQFAADPSGNYPAAVPGAIGHDYWATAVGWQDSDNTIPVVPAP